MNGIRCPSCSAPLMEKPASPPAVCGRCGTSFHFDEYGSYVPLVVPCKVDENGATSKIMAWAAGVKGGREFSKNIKLARMSRRFYPVYRFDRSRNGSSASIVASAVAVAEPGIRNASLDDVGTGNVAIGPADQNELVKPNLSPTAYEKLLYVDPSSRALVYYPFWCTQYVYHGKLSIVTVDGSTGRVSGDLSVELERKSGMPLAAAAFAAIGMEGALAFVSWMFAVAAVAITAGVTLYLAHRNREE